MNINPSAYKTLSSPKNASASLSKLQTYSCYTSLRDMMGKLNGTPPSDGFITFAFNMHSNAEVNS